MIEARASGTTTADAYSNTGIVTQPLRTDTPYGAEVDGTTTTLQPGVSPAEPSLPPLQPLPPPDPSNPVISPGFPDYNQYLPRVGRKETLVPLLAVEAVRLEINGNDYSDCYLRGDVAFSLNGPSAGSAQLIELPTIDLNPDINTDLRRGVTFRFSTLVEGTEVLEFDGYIVEIPDYRAYPGRVCGELSLIVGDIFRRLDGEALTLETPYCGPHPRTAGEWCQLYLQLRAPDRRDSFPNGAALIEPSYAIRKEAAFNAIADRMGADGRTVRTSPNGQIITERRPSFDAETAIAITDDDLISAPRRTARGLLPFSRITGFSNGIQLEVPQKRVVTDRIYPDGYDESDFRPYFVGGRNNYEERTRSFYGDVLTSERRRFYARVPTASSVPSTGVDGTSDPCLGSGGWDGANTEFKLVRTFHFDIISKPHPSGKRLIEREESYNEGEDWINDGTNWVRYPSSGTAKFNERIEDYANRPFKDRRTCERDWIWGVYRHQIIEREVLSSSDTEPTTVREFTEYWYANGDQSIQTGDVSGTTQRWRKETVEKFLDRQQGAYITRPTVVEKVPPPLAPWIPLQGTAIEIEYDYEIAEIEQIWGKAEPAEPIPMPFVYNDINARRFLDAYLRDVAGYFDSYELDIPWNLGIQIGDSCTFEGKSFICVGVAKSWANQSASVTISLSREY